ncbi:MAG TPA: ribonuclease J [Alphaproteobacteria bacterium]|nr:ribonuclease J [Alphaproteobacteria bacterium]USO06124.1 MAG: ribonuclease J [Rhodospirillales bacterium]HOO82078.1 ribonuclease J [Alphaproteobacteria bacterium]
MSVARDLMSQDGLFFIPLGGSEQFGVNLNVYVSDGQMLAVDCGIGFADDRFPGIDLLLPDPTFLEERREALKGLIITHAHEDHVGAVAYVWDRLQCPIYASPFTAAVLRKKLEEQNVRRVKIEIITPGVQVQIGAFGVHFVPVSHSVPDTCSLIIDTDHGKLVHSGDWNLDPAPVTGAATDAAIFKRAGEEGVLAYIGDSTNAEVDGRSGSESVVAKGLEAEFRKCDGKIAVTTFSSNIGRVISILKAAKACGRQVGVIGRSLHRMIGCAADCGLLDKNLPDFVSEEDLGYLPDDKVVVIVTGSQGEYRAALAKVARGVFKGFKLNKGDSVIFSARAIPGNEVSINQVKNNLSAAGVNIITPRDTKNIIHVSGHPCRDEIADMLRWVRPQVVVPVHGERVQLDAQAAFARDCQVPKALVPSNGSVIRLAPGNPEIVDHIETDILAVDQKRIVKATHQSIAARRKLQYTGAVHISLAVDARGKFLGDPKFEMLGLLDLDNPGEEQIEDKLYDEILDLLEELTFEERLDDHFIAEELRIGIRRFCDHTLGIKPKTTVHVLRV